MQQIGRNIASLLLSRVTSGIILLLIYFRLLDYFGPDIAGQYALISGFLMIANIFVDLGMQQLIIKKVSENLSEAKWYLSNYFGIQFLLGFGFMLVLDAIAITSHYPEIVKNALYVTGLSLFISSLTYPFMAIINAYQRLHIIAIVNFINSMINVGMILLTIHLHKNIFFLSFVNLFAAVVDLIIYVYIVNRRFTKFEWKFDYNLWKGLFIVNLPFTLITIFSVYNRVDTLLIPHLRSFTENGYYGAAYKFWDTLAFIPAIVTASLYPFFSESLVKGQKDNVRKGLEAYTRYMISLALPLIVGSYLLSYRLTLTFLKAKFAPAASVLWILVAAVAVLFIYSPVNSLIISQKTKTAAKIIAFTFLLNLMLNLIFIPKYGFVAAGVVTLISECVQWIGYTYVVKKSIIDFTLFRHFIKPGVAALIMGIVIKLTYHLNLFIIVPVAMGVYFFVLYISRFFHKEDRTLLFGGLKITPSVAPVERDVL
jgi:O-antigen/teichoic acid export membrane protein